MTDFFVALGLVLVIEGLLFAAFPGFSKRGMQTVIDTPELRLRQVGIACAVVGLIVVWAIRG